MTEHERDVIDAAIKWREATFDADKAVRQEELNFAVDLLLQERRDKQAQEAKA